MAKISQPKPSRKSEPTLALTVINDTAAGKLLFDEAPLAEWRKRILEEHANSKQTLPLLSGNEFGDIKSKRGSLRYNANVKSMVAIVVEHDAGTLSFDKAIARLKKAKLLALAYTSPSFEKANKERVSRQIREAKIHRQDTGEIVRAEIDRILLQHELDREEEQRRAFAAWLRNNNL